MYASPTLTLPCGWKSFGCAGELGDRAVLGIEKRHVRERARGGVGLELVVAMTDLVVLTAREQTGHGFGVEVVAAAHALFREPVPDRELQLRRPLELGRQHFVGVREIRPDCRLVDVRRRAVHVEPVRPRRARDRAEVVVERGVVPGELGQDRQIRLGVVADRVRVAELLRRQEAVARCRGSAASPPIASRAGASRSRPDGRRGASDP